MADVKPYKFNGRQLYAVVSSGGQVGKKKGDILKRDFTSQGQAEDWLRKYAMGVAKDKEAGIPIIPSPEALEREIPSTPPEPAGVSPETISGGAPELGKRLSQLISKIEPVWKERKMIQEEGQRQAGEIGREIILSKLFPLRPTEISKEDPRERFIRAKIRTEEEKQEKESGARARAEAMRGGPRTIATAWKKAKPLERVAMILGGVGAMGLMGKYPELATDVRAGMERRKAEKKAAKALGEERKWKEAQEEKEWVNKQLLEEIRAGNKEKAEYYESVLRVMLGLGKSKEEAQKYLRDLGTLPPGEKVPPGEGKVLEKVKEKTVEEWGKEGAEAYRTYKADPTEENRQKVLELREKREKAGGKVEIVLGSLEDAQIKIDELMKKLSPSALKTNYGESIQGLGGGDKVNKEKIIFWREYKKVLGEGGKGKELMKMNEKARREYITKAKKEAQDNTKEIIREAERKERDRIAAAVAQKQYKETQAGLYERQKIGISAAKEAAKTATKRKEKEGKTKKEIDYIKGRIKHWEAELKRYTKIEDKGWILNKKEKKAKAKAVRNLNALQNRLKKLQVGGEPSGKVKKKSKVPSGR